MRIHKAGNNINLYKLGFKSIRTDKREVAALSSGVNPLGENQKINILNSLNNLVNNPERQTIEFLLSVADNLAYGQNGDSEFKDLLDEDALTPPERENTNWSEILENTILQALHAVKEEDIADLQEDYFRIFGSKKELTPEQKEIIDLRSRLTAAVIDEETLSDEDALILRANIRKNLDYFVASSEISAVQKKECLEKFIYMLSDDYKISPQLKDKKLNVIDEMLNDMVIKTPQDDVLTIKDVDQRASGICAAISICRKAIAYEDKTQYMNIVMEELKDSPVMEVFDITELQSGKKVSIAKPVIDYDSALARGYRILDASAHIWMQNAHASGNGTLLTESYTAFDDDSYGIFDDASWYEGLDENYSPAKNFLKALIKEREFLKAIDKRSKTYKTLSETIAASKDKIIKHQGKVVGRLNTLFSEIFKGSEYSDADISGLIRSLAAFYKGSSEDNEVYLSSKLPKEVRQKLIIDFIKEKVPSLSEEQKAQLEGKANSVLELVGELVESENELLKAKNLNTNRSKFRYYKNLFSAAAAHRLALEADVNMPDGVLRYEKFSNIPPKDIRVVSFLKDLKKEFASDNVRSRFKDEHGNIPSQSSLEQDITEDIIAVETTVPQQINMIILELFGKNFNMMLSDIYKSNAAAIAGGDSVLQSIFSSMLGTKNDKSQILSSLKKWSDKLEKSSLSDAEQQEAVRILGFEDRMHAASTLVYSYFNAIKTGLSQEQYDELVKRFGEENLASELETLRLQFNDLRNGYDAILQRWNVPSSRALIIDRMEKSKSVLTRKKLDSIQRRINEISAKLVKNESITNLKQRKKADEEACKLLPEDLEIINQLEKSIPAMKSYSKRYYKSLNDYLFDALEKQYSYIGMLNGQFWVREEGSSGLSSNEQVRIIEQMTGKPYHIEYDVNDAVKQIKEGKGSGILSTSVDDSDYAFHAQYIPAVTVERFINPVTKQETTGDVLWTDNSWGRIENESFWNGHNGHYYTDYARGFGWKDGFILDKSFRIGQRVKDIHCASGYAKKDKEKFSLFGDVVLPGAPVNIYQRLYKMFHNIFDMSKSELLFESLESQVGDQGYKLDIDFLTSLDDLAEAVTEKLGKRLEREIKSEADFNNLSDDDELKIAMNKIAVYMATDNPNLKDVVYDTKTLEEIEDIKQTMIEEHIDVFGEILGKSDSNCENIYKATKSSIDKVFDDILQMFGVELTPEQKVEIYQDLFFDSDSLKSHNGSLKGLEHYFALRIDKVASEKIKNEEAAEYFIDKVNGIVLNNIDSAVRIKSLDSPVLVNSPLYKEFIAAVDKYLKPKNDEELLQLIQGLQEADYETVDVFISALEPEDLGLVFKSPYDYVRRYLTSDSTVTRAFSEVIGTDVIYSNIKVSDDPLASSPEEIYRDLYVKLSEMDVQKYVKKFKAEAFAKYKLRQAFPQPVVFPDEKIEESAVEMINTFKEQVYSLKANQFILDILKKFSAFINKYKDDYLYKSLLNGENVSVEDNKSELIAFLNDLRIMCNFISQDESLNDLSDLYSQLINLISSSTEYVDGKKVSSLIKRIEIVFGDWDSSSVNESRFHQNISEEQKRLRDNIDIFVAGSIDPKYKDEAISRIKEIINLYRKEAPEAEIENLKQEFVNFVVKRHITKNPTVLLSETVKCLQNGKRNSGEYQILKTYLIKALIVAQQTKIQYKLVQNQHEGISSKTKDMLPLFSVTMADGTVEPMDSPTGMIYLIQQLSNESDGNTTLNLFLDQSGLAKDALAAIIDNFEVEKSKELVDENHKAILQSIDDLKYLSNILTEYFDKSRITYSSFKDAFEQISKYLKRKTQERADSEMIKSFLAYIDSVQIMESTSSPNTPLFKQIVTSVTDDGLEYLSGKVNHIIEFVEEIPKLLESRAELLNAIKVPEDSDEYKKREKFMESYIETQEYIASVLNSIYQEVLNVRIQSTEE